MLDIFYNLMFYNPKNYMHFVMIYFFEKNLKTCNQLAWKKENFIHIRNLKQD